MIKFLLKKVKGYEYRPYYILYFPFVPVWLWYSFRTRSLAYCTLTNPSIYNGGLLNYNKEKIVENIPNDYKPFSKIIVSAEEEILEFPFVAKPEYGARGVGVEVVRNQRDWQSYVQENSPPYLLQEYIDLPYEFGIFYYRFPNEKSGRILGITGKNFLKIKGDGAKTLSELVNENPRAKKRKEYFSIKFKNEWNNILARDETILLEEIGNHNRGTEFFDASELLTERLIEKVDELAKRIPEYYYGRWDVKAKSIEDFQNAQFVILEANGTNSEATHIYDSSFTLYDAYSIVWKKLNIQYQIAKQNKNRKFKSAPTLRLAKEIWKEACIQLG